MVIHKATHSKRDQCSRIIAPCRRLTCAYHYITIFISSALLSLKRKCMQTEVGELRKQTPGPERFKHQGRRYAFSIQTS